MGKARIGLLESEYRKRSNLGYKRLPKGFAMAHHKHRDPYILTLLTKTEKVKGRQQRRDINPNPKLFFKICSNRSLSFLATKTKKNK